MATFRVGNDDVVLDVEVRAESEGSFRPLSQRGISPIGEFPDWSAVSKERRTALDRVARCVDAAMPDEIFAGSPRVSQLQNGGSAFAKRAGPPTLPWRLLFASSAGVFVIVSIARRSRAAFLRTGAPLLALGIATWGFRYFAYPIAFFHQNGHGALWVDCALGGHCPYGPGFREVFSLAAQLDPTTAEQGVFLAHGWLGATAPIAAWLLVRASGAPRIVAWALALVLAIEPGLGRLAQSESYFGVVTWLLFGAAALLATAARLGQARSPVFGVAIGGAGLLIAQAAIVHPIAWVPSAVVPLVAFVGPGSFQRRLRLWMIATLGTGFVALASSGAVVLAVYKLHAHWGGTFSTLLAHSLFDWARFAVMSIVLLVGFALARRRRGLGRSFSRYWRFVLRLLVLVAVLGLAATLNPFDNLTPWIRHAWFAPYLPVAFAATGALAAKFRSAPILSTAIALVIMAAGIAFSWVRGPSLLVLPTDALEARLATSWRGALPEGARVLQVERIGQRISTLPLYRISPREIRLFKITDGNAEQAISASRAPLSYYYRSSVCSSDDGRAFCENLERRWELEPVRTASLPALPSMPHLPYDTDSVEIGLYRIIGSAAKDASSSTARE